MWRDSQMRSSALPCWKNGVPTFLVTMSLGLWEASSTPISLVKTHLRFQDPSILLSVSNELLNCLIQVRQQGSCSYFRPQRSTNFFELLRLKVVLSPRP